MKTIRKVEYRHEYVEFIPDKMEVGVLYVAEQWHTTNHLCLCGCGRKVSLPLNHGEGITKDHGWNLIKENNGTVSLTPSIGNYKTCGSHYIMTKGVANFV